ncbi:phosphoribosyltransferase [Thermocrinis minervae]|uniref:Predicted phosphoribosyltransferase n=1 Tax=Thermocrinis minervae TaxID=381751 RepID=A0A1M6RQL0_9AQUI|nr:phosphoribosyltransferase family protein [Thermocrinis minervae]SHK34756.1 Predicted phosphoribosyltransferase [Thermocrinis minervae]
MTFFDRADAGKLLGEYLKENMVQNHVDVVLGIPRGGVLVAKEVARALGKPLGVLLVRKLGVPSNPELAFGAVDPDGEVYLDQSTVDYFGLSEEDIKKVVRNELEKIRERERRFAKALIDPEGKQLLIVDDGIATGLTVLAGIGYLRRKGAKSIYVAAPVCPASTIQRLTKVADKVYCYHVVGDSSFAVGIFYRDFRQVTDEEVEEVLSQE